ncbi:MAG: phosphoribosylanthranilate isomerase [Halioglobus sp.]
MAQTRIKICGITRPEDARVAAASGADAIGLVFYAKSPRAVSVEKARECIKALPPLVTVVALFVNETAENIGQILRQVPIDVLQFHGDETPEFCEQFGRPYLKALRVRSSEEIAQACEIFRTARALLLDAWVEGVPGGTGQTFDWSMAQGSFSLPLILAGGLNSDNVGGAIELLKPSAVDVSGGTESSPGIKSAASTKGFVEAVRSADLCLKR